MRCFVSKETNICDKTGPLYMKGSNKNTTKERNYTVIISVVKPSNTSVKSTNKFKINRKHSQIHRFFYEKVLLEDLSSLHAQAVARRSSVKNGFLKISPNSRESTCARVSFLIKLHATLFKKRLSRKCFPVNFAKFLRAPLFIQHLQWLLLGKY